MSMRATRKPARLCSHACKAANIPCGIFTGNAKPPSARRDQGYPIVVVANDIEVVAGGFARAMAQFAGKADKTKAKSAGYLSNEKDEDVSDLLLKFASFIADGRIRVVDLTQTLKPSTPVIQLAAAARAHPIRSGSWKSRATTSAVRAGTGTTSPAASIPARISMRRRIG